VPRKADLRGIEQRVDSLGREQYRATVTHPENRKLKLRGPWTYSFAEAKGWRVQALAKQGAGVSLLPKKVLPTVREASDDFLAGAKSGVILSRKQERYAAKTLRGYEQTFRDWINPELGHVRIDELRRSQVQRFVDGVSALRSGSTTRNIVHGLGALYSYLLPRHDELGHDPTVGLLKPRAAGPRERYAEPQEAAALLGALPHELALPYALAFYAGLRRGEIQSLPVDAIDLGGGWIDVRYSLDVKQGFKGPKSGAGERSVPIFASLRPYLERQLEAIDGEVTASTEAAPGTLLLPSTRPGRFGTRELGTKFLDACRVAWGWVWVEPEEGKGAWERAREDALEPIGLHEARHSFATGLVRAGYDVKTVSEWIGHAQASTTLNVYAKHRGRQDATALVATMDSYLAAASA
jgi:integrase